MWDFCLESLNAESASGSPLAERDGLAAQAVAETATYREPLPDSAPRAEGNIGGTGFPLPEPQLGANISVRGRHPANAMTCRLIARGSRFGKVAGGFVFGA